MADLDPKVLATILTTSKPPHAMTTWERKLSAYAGTRTLIAALWLLGGSWARIARDFGGISRVAARNQGVRALADSNDSRIRFAETLDYEVFDRYVGLAVGERERLEALTPRQAAEWIRQAAPSTMEPTP